MALSFGRVAATLAGGAMAGVGEGLIAEAKELHQARRDELQDQRATERLKLQDEMAGKRQEASDARQHQNRMAEQEQRQGYESTEAGKKREHEKELKTIPQAESDSTTELRKAQTERERATADWYQRRPATGSSGGRGGGTEFERLMDRKAELERQAAENPDDTTIPSMIAGVDQRLAWLRKEQPESAKLDAARKAAQADAGKRTDLFGQKRDEYVAQRLEYWKGVYGAGTAPSSGGQGSSEMVPGGALDRVVPSSPGDEGAWAVGRAAPAMGEDLPRAPTMNRGKLGGPPQGSAAPASQQQRTPPAQYPDAQWSEKAGGWVVQRDGKWYRVRE